MSSQPTLQFFLDPAVKARGVSFTAPRLGDAGFDIAAAERTVIEKGFSAKIPTGLHLAIPLGWVGLIRDRSSVAARGGVTGAGVIDSSYRGEVRILMFNFGSDVLEFQPGERIAQCLILPHHAAKEITEVRSLEELGATERGAGGFGSTGR